MEYEDEEYEIVPTTPIRRMEKRLARMESTTTSSEVNRLMEQIIELIKSNQRVIDDVIKADAELRNEVSRLPTKIDQLLSTMNDFVEILKASAVEEGGTGPSSDSMAKLTQKLDELVQINKKGLEANEQSIRSMDMIEKRLKRLHLEFANAFRR
ncbi:MAG: hypothetical protein KKA90_04930 [Nanoarchaeota archaeon]|nr:hypothetical protein [Nanoarchaeota archaeon]